MYCPKCGSQNDDGCNFCKVCGINLFIKSTNNMNEIRIVSEKNWFVALLLCIFLGAIGIHRFYVGKMGTAILMILTFGGFGIWWAIDLIFIVTNLFTDRNGLKLNKDINKSLNRY